MEDDSTPKPAAPAKALPPNNAAEAIPAFTTVGRKPGPIVSSKTLFIIIIKSAKTGTLHAVMNPKSGPGVLATFEDVEQAVNVTTNMRECKTNEFFILPVGE